ncbi:alanine racemase [Desulfobotulus alkaliphilus]|uniref:Alanine racemase n=1 Tax=Desulfobotulus alkaliphilus TaxID=622671 RepID=A0A562RIQ0_9BACT|nr:alanine racemase [Desulfobotulus alkaliphilus]TWI68911.1 alanine racemase [Desulfobotulus alkaliphilus]
MTPLAARINLETLKKNIALVRSHLPDTIKIMGVVKCNAYGHGLSQISKIMAEAGLHSLVVSGLDEGISLRKSGINCPVLALNDPLYPSPSHALEYDLSLTVADADFALKLAAHKPDPDQKFRVHIKVDTGLGRFGFSPDQAEEIMNTLDRIPHIQVDGIYSHLACSFQDDARSNAFTEKQFRIFDDLLDRLEDSNLMPDMVHLGSSTGLLGFPDRVCSGRLNALRIGTLFYGYAERVHEWEREPTPIAHISTRIIQIRDVQQNACIGYHGSHQMQNDGRVAVIHCGFDQGLHSLLPGKLLPAVHGIKCPLIGRPALTQSMLDVSDVSEAVPGNKVILAGPDINLFQAARSADRGIWEVLLPLLKNAEKTYHNGTSL